MSFQVLNCDAGMVGVKVGIFSRIMSENCLSFSSPTGNLAFAIVSTSLKFSALRSQQCALMVASTMAATALGLDCAVFRKVTMPL